MAEWKLWSEEKPKEEVNILVTREFYDGDTTKRYVETGMLFGGDYLSDIDEYCIYPDAMSEPIAWMPFPKPYKGDKAYER